MGDLRVGCAGWSYRDWVGPVYASHLPASRWLDAYADLFPLVEIDSTFYATPARATVDSWIERIRDHREFAFTAKLPQDVTHRSLPTGASKDLDRALEGFLANVVGPLEDAGRLAALLVQLPPTYAVYDTAGSVDAVTALTRLLDRLAPRERRVAVEFRHGSWYEHVGETLVNDAVDALAGIGASAAQVDGLGSRFTRSRTAPWSYFRLHGRRTHIPPSERSLSHAPYNYLYTKAEIQDVAAAIAGHRAVDASTLVIFNNHYRGQAAHNAMDLIEALGGPRPRPAAPFKRETRLDDFASS